MPYLNTITRHFDSIASSRASETAIWDDGRSISFGELRARALGLAAAISAKLNGATGQAVAVWVPKSIDAIVVDMAILYSGNACMNLDVKSPWPRAAKILENINPALILHGATPPPDCGIAQMSVERHQAVPASLDNILRLSDSRIDADIAFIINTSGSTGTPKGVALTHRGFIDYVDAVSSEGLVDDGEVVASLAPIIFDHFCFEFCLLAMKGCQLVLIPEKLAAFPARMLELMSRRGATFLFWVPTIMVNIANMDLLNAVKLPSLKKIWFAGEVFPTAKFNYWRGHFPDALFVNLYGPTEITVDCLFYRACEPLPDSEPVPVGRPLPNTAVMLLDENGAEIGPDRPGVDGELCVRGSSLAPGYYNNPCKTAEVFTQNPFNPHYPENIYHTGDIMVWNSSGDLVFKGRRDGMIKHYGHRIELGEIEHAAINVLKLFDNCCAMYDADNKRILLAYESAREMPEKELRPRLGAVLPRHMIPAAYARFKELPRNANGKIDRLKLKNEMIGKTGEGHGRH